MFGELKLSAKGVDTTSSSAQSLPSGAYDKVVAAEGLKIPVEIRDMVASTVGVGPVKCEGLYKSSTSIVGTIPALGKTATFANTNKVTLSS